MTTTGYCSKGVQYSMLLGIPHCSRREPCEYQGPLPTILTPEGYVDLVVCGEIFGDKNLSKLPIIRGVASSLEDAVESSLDTEHRT